MQKQNILQFFYEFEKKVTPYLAVESNCISKKKQKKSSSSMRVRSRLMLIKNVGRSKILKVGFYVQISMNETIFRTLRDRREFF